MYENVPAHFGPSWGANWMDGEQIGSRHDPAWATQLKWQKSLVDWYGYDKLVRFNAGAGDEFSASNAFETGKVAMNMDGEWRVAFIKREHPELDYGTAPFPVADDHPELYGAGYVTGSIIGIPKTSKHKDAGVAARQVPRHELRARSRSSRTGSRTSRRRPTR